MFILTGSIQLAPPGLNEAEDHLLRVAVLGVGVERIDGAAVRDALHTDGGVV